MSDLSDAIRQQNLVAEDWLIHYPTRKKEFEEALDDIICPWKPEDENIGGGKSNIPGRPTESMGLALAEHDTSNEARWLELIAELARVLDDKKRLLVAIRQEGCYYSSGRGRPAWTAYACARFADNGYYTSADVLRNMWADVVNVTVRAAIIRGCEV